MSKAKFIVLSTVKYGGKYHAPGATLDLVDAVAAPLVACGAVEPYSKEAARSAAEERARLEAETKAKAEADAAAEAERLAALAAGAGSAGSAGK